MAAFSFLVLGAGRSGTSLLAALIDAHPMMACGMEFQSIALLGNPIPSVLFTDSSKNRLRHFKKACDNAAKQSPKLLWGNKITTEQIALLRSASQSNLLTDFQKVFEKQRIIFVHRDGRTCIPSKVIRGGKSLKEAISLWKEAVAFGRWLNQKQQPTALSIHYEDLLKRPEDVLKTICSFLDQPFDAVMLEGVKSNKLPEMYRYGKLLDGKTTTPFDSASWQEEINEELTLLGYL